MSLSPQRFAMRLSEARDSSPPSRGVYVYVVERHPKAFVLRVVPKQSVVKLSYRLGIIINPGRRRRNDDEETKKPRSFSSYLSDLLRPSGQIEAFSPLPGLVVFHRRRRRNDLVVNFRLRHRDRVWRPVLASSSPMSTQKRTRRR